MANKMISQGLVQLNKIPSWHKISILFGITLMRCHILLCPSPINRANSDTDLEKVLLLNKQKNGDIFLTYLHRTLNPVK